MFCRFCGKEISDDSLFCQYCGNNLGSENSLISTSTSTNALDVVIGKEAERKGVSIYINQLLQFESIVQKLKSDATELENKIQEKQSNLGWKTYPHSMLFTKYDNPLRFHAGNFILEIPSQNGAFGFHYVDSSVRAFVYSCIPTQAYEGTYLWWDISNAAKKDWFSKDIVDVVEKKQLVFFKTHYTVPSNCIWNCMVNPVVFGQEIFGSQRNLFANPQVARNLWLSDYDDFLKNKDTLIDSQTEEISVLTKQLDDIKSKTNEASDILVNLYSVNLIPSKARNIESMYYICDYFDTSNESLSSILFHLDFDEIKAKFETVVKNQQQAIINQAILISQNDELIRQNESCLFALSDLSEQVSNKLSDIESKVTSTANWTKIAANNAEACAWIGAANYLFK